MASALDSAYEWGINPQNAKNLSPQELMGLGSLAPQSGIGLMSPTTETPLNPLGNLPTPKFAPNAASYFGFEQPALANVAHDIATTGQANPLAFEQGQANVGNSENAGSKQPYFDPNYPYESMLALKNWLSPQVAAGVTPAENARGLNYSGVGKYAGDRAQSYLDQLAPIGETGQQALGNDMGYLYGPNIANSLIEGTADRPGSVISYLPPSIGHGASPLGNGNTNAQAALVANPGYQQAEEATPPSSGNLTDFGPGSPGGGFRVGGGGTYTQPGTPAQQGTPQFGLYDLASGNQYAGPGYWYNPNQPPDTARMPWLQNATPYSASTGA